MNHRQRIRLANKITQMLVRKYGEEILLGGICGSTARSTDTEYSDLEIYYIVNDRSKAKSFSFAYQRMPVSVTVQKKTEVEKDIEEITDIWPLKMGRLFNLKPTCGSPALLERFRRMLDSIPQEKFSEFIAQDTALCYEGLNKLKAVKLKGNVHELGLFVAEVLINHTRLTAIYNREFINNDYLGGLFESFKFKHLPRDYERIARRLLSWNELNIDEIIRLGDELGHNFAVFMAENGIKVKEHTPLQELDI